MERTGPGWGGSPQSHVDYGHSSNGEFSRSESTRLSSDLANQPFSLFDNYSSCILWSGQGPDGEEVPSHMWIMVTAVTVSSLDRRAHVSLPILRISPSLCLIITVAAYYGADRARMGRKSPVTCGLWSQQ